jgi:Na+-transporting methylmalonyl-CoA/oxaloacetate decarboxylase gamma subunit
VIDRTRRAPDPYLDWKVRTFFAGALLAAAGVLLGYRVLVLLAIIVLIVGLFATTILGKRHARAQAEAEAEAEDEGDIDSSDPQGGPHPLA